MSVSEGWAYTEECLPQVADSMGHLLTRIRPHVSNRLIAGPGWVRLIDRAREIPVTMAAFPFGFEVRLEDPEPRADFGVSLVGDSRTAAHYQNGDRAQDPSTAGPAWFLNETDRESSLLRSVVGRTMLLEYDIEVAENGTRPDPGIFLYPINDALASGGGRLRELHAVHDALVIAGGWSPDAAERRQVDRLYGVLAPNTIIRAFGTFPSRERTMRFAVTGFTKAEDVSVFLDRAGWPGNSSAAGDVVSFFGERKAFAYLGLHFDITADGVGPNLGLSFFAHQREWLRDIRHWTPVISAIGERESALPGKLAEFSRWSTGSETLLAKSGPIRLFRGIHHIKLAMTGDQIGSVKGYVFFLMIADQPKRRVASGL
ncbi:MAG: hypothetical protein OXE82_12450 [Rhodobacter sp.]|nr:hypothetical protein [Rhodobacter sp.]